VSDRDGPASAHPGPTTPAIHSPAGTDGMLCLDLGVDNLYTMRAAVAAHASRFGLTESKVDRLLVVATELAANTIRHADGTGTLRLWRDGDAVRCQVSDRGPGIADPQHAGTAPVALISDGGRGLWLSRRLSDQLTITDQNGGSTVTVTMTI
jgi:anti-sigma regulatory factor (Ser/Thr protein kinase)